MIVISNTSPIIYLSVIGQLDLLRQLYGEILIPTAVFNEITNVGNTDASAVIVPTLDWIQTRQVANRVLADTLLAEIDSGEAEAIALFIELNADRLLIDERLGRTAAIRLGVGVTGVLGVLIAARRRGLIPAVRPLLDELIEQSGFWVGEELYVEVLQAVGEG
ncbi:MAG: DUF3368 domain-containing protein [Coleofasciculaceae cyanobacterium]